MLKRELQKKSSRFEVVSKKYLRPCETFIHFVRKKTSTNKSYDLEPSVKQWAMASF
jgi:hypothetical protein